MKDLATFSLDWPLDVPTAIRNLRAATSRIDDLISEAEHNISLSKERRAVLISAAVTGQIGVSTEKAA
jgi:type I restriction enzyme S subunit